MRFTALLVSLLILPQAWADEQAKEFDFYCGTISPGLPLSIQDKYFTYYGFHLNCNLKPSTGGSGVLQLDPNAPAYDEFGYLTTSADLPLQKYDCTFKFVKKGKVRVQVGRRIGGEEKDIEWTLFEIKGPKITSKLFLAVEFAETYPSARLLVHDNQGKVKNVVGFYTPGPPEPCHPGCFPAGTKIVVGSETKAIETIRVGDSITTIDKNGKPGESKVTFIFVTKNRLIEVETDKGTLVTTETQPLSLASGVLRAAGELKEGNQVFRWIKKTCVPATVKSVKPTIRYESVYNLVLGDPTLFIANGFLARSKPPAVVEATK